MRYISYFLIIGLCAFASVASDQEQVEKPLQVGEDAPDFTLQDAEDQEHALKKMRGKVVFLIMGNRKIREEDDKWGHAFQKDYKKKDQVVAYIVADMRSVPAFVPKGFIKRQLKKDKPPVTLLLDWKQLTAFVPKGFIKRQLKKDKPPVTLLLDWKGKVHQAYRTERKKSQISISLTLKGNSPFI